SGSRLYIPRRVIGESWLISAAVSLATRSPSLKAFTALPSAAISPQNSWPRMTGTRTDHDCVLWYWWTSLPQTPTPRTRSSTSFSAMSGPGMSRSSTAPFFISVWTTAGIWEAMLLSLHFLHEVRDRLEQLVRIRSRLELVVRHRQRRADHDQLRAELRALRGLVDREAADGLQGDLDGVADLLELVEGRLALLPVALVEPDMVDDDVDAHLLHLLRHRDLVGAQHDVAHDIAVELLGRAHGLADRVFVGLAHDDDERRAVPVHHLRLEVSGVHRLQVRDDRMIRILLMELRDRVQPLAEDERRADLEPVDARLDGDLRRGQRVGHRLQVEGQLDLGLSVQEGLGHASSFKRP